MKWAANEAMQKGVEMGTGVCTGMMNKHVAGRQIQSETPVFISVGIKNYER